MGQSVAPQRRSSDRIIDSAYDDHLKDLEVKNPAALSLVRRYLRDSVVFPMPVRPSLDVPVRPTL